MNMDHNQIVLTVMKISFHFNSCGVVFGVYCTLRRLLDCDHVGKYLQIEISIDAFIFRFHRVFTSHIIQYRCVVYRKSLHFAIFWINLNFHITYICRSVDYFRQYMKSLRIINATYSWKGNKTVFCNKNNVLLLFFFR